MSGNFNKNKRNAILATIIISLSIIIFAVIIWNLSDDKTQYNYTIQNRFSNLEFDSPLDIQSLKQDNDYLFVVERGGKIYAFENDDDVQEKSLFLDISDIILNSGEQGLLGLAFHPNFEQNGYFYVIYVSKDQVSTLSRFSVGGDIIEGADESSEKKLLELKQPYANHNGGQIAFGPDGYLYISLGDGGGTGDPMNNAQDRTNLFGTISRIDVDSGEPYAIPESNPYYGNEQGFKEEIYAYGLRNPWRFSFDSETENLWTADVGQNAYEEINIIYSGKNYGWNILEGEHCYESENCEEPNNYGAPIHEYNHSLGRSVTGGYVYRGSSLKSLQGKYIYADFISGKIWALSFNNNEFVKNEQIAETDLRITSFGIDSSNELYFCAFDGNLYSISEI